MVCSQGLDTWSKGSSLDVSQSLFTCPLLLSCSQHHSSNFHSLLNRTISVVCKGLLMIQTWLLHLIDQTLSKEFCLFLLYFHLKCLAQELSPSQSRRRWPDLSCGTKEWSYIATMQKGKNTHHPHHLDHRQPPSLSPYPHHTHIFPPEKLFCLYCVLWFFLLIVIFISLSSIKFTSTLSPTPW